MCAILASAPLVPAALTDSTCLIISHSNEPLVSGPARLKAVQCATKHSTRSALTATKTTSFQATDTAARNDNIRDNSSFFVPDDLSSSSPLNTKKSSQIPLSSSRLTCVSGWICNRIKEEFIIKYWRKKACFIDGNPGLFL